MDVVHARADLVRVGEGAEGLQQLHLRARGLDGDDVGVHGGDGGDHVVELAVAHVGVDLRLVAHAAGGQAEGLGGPVQVGLPAGLAQRQALAEGRLVDLDDADAGGLQVAHLVADRQRQLAGLLLAGDVVARERPHQHGHRAGQHALHHLGGLALGVADPVHRHRPRPAEVAVDDRRLHAARPVALHPAEAGEGVAVQLLGEVLDHVVALGLAVHQHVQAQLFLHPHGVADLGAHGLGVLGRRQRALPERLARLADLGGLREGADGGGREQRQLQVLALRGDAPGERRLAPAVLGADRRQARLHRRIVDARRGRARRLHGAACGQRLLHPRRLRIAQGLGQHGDLRALLHGEGQPALQLGIQPILASQIHRAVQQRTGGAHPQPLAQARLGLLEHAQGLVEVGAPHVAAIDHAQRQHLVGRQPVEHHRELLGGAHQVHVQAIHRQAGGQRQVVLQAGEVGGDQLLARLALQQVVGALESGLPGLRQVEAEDRLVDLHPFRAQRLEALEDFAVHRQQALQQVEALERLTAHLAQPQVGQRADDHRLDRMAQRAGFGDLLEQLFPAQLERLVGGEFGDQVVVVAVEPLGHFLGVGAATAAAADAARHGEQGVQGRSAAVVGAEALGDHAEHQRMGEHLVVPGEIADRQQVDAGVLLQLPVFGAQLATDLAQAGRVQRALPVGFEGFLQLAVAADAGESEGVGNSHLCSPVTVAGILGALES